ncbi:2453_t:CDS:2 [Dentiscutata erythropus]|uniref:2453_t:CDS:1 n=1 Tax=Dentiscutata erythropus TaxID=1348616 RepID=A0A9N9AZW7_9GLOM|nr:2453_t:CDS:2 [Dentiscutata erythropus]
MNSGALTGPVNTTTAIVATTTTSQTVATTIATTCSPTAPAISNTTNRVRAQVACDSCKQRKKKCTKIDDEPCVDCEKRIEHKPQIRGLYRYHAESYNLDQTDQHHDPPSSFVPINVIGVSSQGHQSVGGLHEPGSYSSGQAELQQVSPVSYGSLSHSCAHTTELLMPMNAVQQNRTRNVGESSPTLGPPVQYPCQHSINGVGHQSVGDLYEPYQIGPYNLSQADRQQVFLVSSGGSPSHFYGHHSENNSITNAPMNAVQQNRTRNVEESSPITNTLEPPVQYPSVICSAPVLMTIYACPRSNIQVQYSCQHSINGVGHQSVGDLYESYQAGSYNLGQANWQQVSPASYGSPSRFYSENNFIGNGLPIQMDAVRTRNVGESSPPVQYPSVICPRSNVQIQYSCEHSAPIKAGTSQGQQQMLVSLGRENNSQAQNSSTIASPTHLDNTNYLNTTSAPEFQTAISQTPVHVNGVEDYTYED